MATKTDRTYLARGPYAIVVKPAKEDEERRVLGRPELHAIFKPMTDTDMLKHTFVQPLSEGRKRLDAKLDIPSRPIVFNHIYFLPAEISRNGKVESNPDYWPIREAIEGRIEDGRVIVAPSPLLSDGKIRIVEMLRDERFEQQSTTQREGLILLWAQHAGRKAEDVTKEVHARKLLINEIEQEIEAIKK